MAEFRVESCRSCHAPIIWATTAATSTAMPVDAEPSDLGNVELEPGPFSTSAPTAIVYAQRPLGIDDLVLRLPHHATCPHADQWKRRNA